MACGDENSFKFKVTFFGLVKGVYGRESTLLEIRIYLSELCQI